MTATERLRALLDERGVEWWPSAECWCEDAITYWRVGAMKWTAIEGEKDLWLNAGIADYEPLTPEQAITATLGCGNAGTDHDSYCPKCGGALHKATLGRGTCRVMCIGEFNGEATEYYDVCSNCGYEFDDDPLNYCPNCGRRISDATSTKPEPAGTELLPCPLCGGDANLVSDYSSERDETRWNVWHDCDGFEGESSGYGYLLHPWFETPWYKDMQTAIAAWNRRTES